MSLLLSDAITEVRDNLNEATAVFWSDAQLTKWIQEGVKTFSSKTLMVEDTQDLDPLIADQLYYDSTDEPWIGDLMEIYSALFWDGTSRWKGLIKVHPRQLGNLATQTSGPTKYYCLHDRKIYIWPLPNATVVAAGAKIQFLFSMVTDDITQMTDEYQHLPIIYATAKAKQRDQKFGEAAALLSQFMQEIAFERNDKHAREVDSLDKFKIPARGGGSEATRG